MDQDLRVIHDEALDGPTNMARDEALLAMAGEGLTPPTLRTYLWSPATVSLGYFQRYANFEALAPPASRLPVVRRLTGGGAILHDQELTYAMVLPSAHPLAGGGAPRLYELAHDALIDCVRRCGFEARRGGPSDGSGAARGPFFCFARRHSTDVLIGGDKLAGSAQRRTRGAVLQHGSIVMGVGYPQQPSAALPGVSPDALRIEFAESLARRTGLPITEGGWTSQELERAARLAPKYASQEWTRAR